MLKAGMKVFLFFLSTCIFVVSPLLAAEKLTIGVAANFILAFEEIARVFEKKTSIRVDGIFTSSGNLYGQIINGAPYDLFLSADQNLPDTLFNKALAETPFNYAKGKVVLWTLRKELCEAGDWGEALMLPQVKRVAIANPETAPYGAASVKALKTRGLWPSVEKRLVYAQTISQAFQYAHTGAVDAGFCAFSSTLSEEGKNGCYLPVEQAADIIQAACILRRTENRSAAERFAAFLCSSEVEAIKRKGGYE